MKTHTPPFQELVLNARDVQVGDWVRIDPTDPWGEVRAIRTGEASTIRVKDGSKTLHPCLIFDFDRGSYMSIVVTGSVFARRARPDYRNLHMCLAPDRSAVRPSMSDEEALAVTSWTCEYCGAQGHIDDLRKRMCNHVYEECEYCGGSPNSNECMPDCSGMAEILNDPSIYVAGRDTNNN
jgi:hypothetical protein